ncbi:hypothetical protein FA15DRAFT_60845 [Coprinopsis marcescibilis]|uniref:Uncharacterized protein n=1 Tax=Coprinopsis marcescibilis TaxID=230819 RepID=A0A5C3L8R3_COPMA|nr:hypothetical protein FA15DRAFT_60845 [Coprinopsis marcescibilis]
MHDTWFPFLAIVLLFYPTILGPGTFSIYFPHSALPPYMSLHLYVHARFLLLLLQLSKAFVNVDVFLSSLLLPCPSRRSQCRHPLVRFQKVASIHSIMYIHHHPAAVNPQPSTTYLPYSLP